MWGNDTAFGPYLARSGYNIAIGVYGYHAPKREDVELGLSETGGEKRLESVDIAELVLRLDVC